MILLWFCSSVNVCVCVCVNSSHFYLVNMIETKPFYILCIFFKLGTYYPRATRCGGDIVTLLWFRPSVCPCVTLWHCERDRNWTIMCIFIKLGTLLNYDERMNPMDFGGQRSKVKVTMDIYGNKLVNTIATKPLCASWSNLADMLAIVRGWSLLILEVRGQRSRSQWTYMEIILWTR